MTDRLKAPFPWFGGKSRVAHMVWARFGDVSNYVEPFFGSGAVLLGRPHDARNETVNDLDCYVSNFWRAVSADSEAVAEAADWPVNEADLHARHRWLHAQHDFRERMHSEKDFYDAEIAGIWVWGISAWIGDNWCRIKTGNARPQIFATQGVHQFIGDGTGLDARRPQLGTGDGVHRQHMKRPNLKKGGVGVNAQRSTGGPGVRQVPDISGDGGASGRGVHARYARDNLRAYFERLAVRLRPVRVCCGNWDRILGSSPTIHIGTTAVFLDPPYGSAERDKVYSCDSLAVASDVRKWCLGHGAEKKLRIALCGYCGEGHEILEEEGWSCVPWKAAGGYGSRGKRKENAYKERIWFSPHCLRARRLVQAELF